MENDTRQHTINPHQRRTGPLFDQRRKSMSALARKRRLCALVRELAHDLGFDVDAVTQLERSELYRAATLALRAEQLELCVTSGSHVGVRVGDQLVRLSSEMRRIMVALRQRAPQPDAPKDVSPWSPLRSQITTDADEVVS